ncbi:MAG: Holliday junction resolvase RuvX [Wenzhouxiangella sp.]
MPEGSSRALLGIDYGKRCTGLAVGHRLTGSARPLEPVRFRDEATLESRIEAVISRWRPERIIVGLPLAGDGSETPMSRSARDFARRLEARCGIRVCLHDERLTSHAAAERHASRRREGRARRRDKANLDSLAAALILESWMSEND